ESARWKILDGPMARIRERTDGAHEVDRRATGVQPTGAFRRYSLELGERSARGRSNARDAGGSDRVRRHVDHQQGKWYEGGERARYAARREPLREVPQRPARLRPLSGE